MRRVKRRNFLRGSAGVLVTLPALDMFRTRTARAWTPLPGGPKRLIVHHHGQGTIMHHWRPTLDNGSLTLPAITEPLDGIKHKCLFIGGVDNKVFGGHSSSDISLYTCDAWGAQPHELSQYDPGHANRASVDEVIARELDDGTTSLRRLDLNIGTHGGPTRHFYNGRNDPIVGTADPREAFNTLFSDVETDPAALDRLRFHRQSVLDTVQDNFRRLRARAGARDRERLDAHAEHIRALERRFEAPSVACSAPTLNLDAGFNYRTDQGQAAIAQIDNMVMAMTCGMVRVGTLDYGDTHGPSFNWLTGSPPASFPGRFDGWHDLVHHGNSATLGDVDEPDLIAGYRWYMDNLAYLLESLDRVPDEDGGSMLDHTLVLSMTEFGNGGGHSSGNLPVIVAGNNGGGAMGRFVDYSGGVSGAAMGQYDGSWMHDDRPGTHNLHVSVLNTFGIQTNTFGVHNGSIVETEEGGGRTITWNVPEGPMPGWHA